MPKIRVLVVDDAVVVRRMVSDVLAADPDIEVVGTAANGRIGVQKVTQVNPDLVTMDVEMPEMDGLEALKTIRQTHPDLPIVMFSTLTERGAHETLEALSLGATDYVTKPANVGSVALAQQRIREELIPKIKGLCGRRVLAASGKDPATRDARRPPLGKSTATAAPPKAPMTSLSGPVVLAKSDAPVEPVEIIAIGVSTGGPNALAEILPHLPGSLPVPIVLVQHMPPMFTRLLAERLDQQSPLKVMEAQGGEVLTPGTVYVAPGNFHLVLQRKGDQVLTVLNQAPPENSCRPAVDPLFRSVAQLYGARALGLILTGMGQDGLRGCEEIRARGGRVLAQDEPTSVVWGMPGFVAKSGLAERVLPLADVAMELTRRCTRPATAAVAAAR